MSDSMPTLADLRLELDESLLNAQAAHSKMTRLLAVLPEGTPAPAKLHDFGYCAEQTLRFANGSPELYARLLALYPPQPLVHLTEARQTLKPLSHVRDNEKDWPMLDIFPVVLRIDKAVGPKERALFVRWWTLLDGKSVEVILEHDGRLQLVPKALADKYTVHGEYACRKEVDPVVRDSSMATWEAGWVAFNTAQGLNAKQVMFVFALKALVRKNPEKAWTLAGLPAKSRPRAEHAFDRIGDFWSTFTAEQVERLLDFVNERSGGYGQAVVESQKEFDAIEQAFAEFFKTRGAPSKHAQLVTEQRVHRHISEATGLRFKLRWMMAPVVPGAEQGVSIRVHFTSEDHHDFQVPYKLGAHLLPQDVPVRYVD